MEPRIQYAKTTDGVNIAYFAIGRGRPLVSMTLPTSHLQIEWQIPEISSYYQMAGRLCTFVRYDHRGFGLSDRDATDFSLNTLVRDVESVTDALKIDTFDLMTGAIAAPVGIAYAIRHPDRLSHLVLVNAAPEGLQIPNDELVALTRLAESNWELASESITHALLGWSQHDAAQVNAAWLRSSVSPTVLTSLMRAAARWNVIPLLSSVRVPTLILHSQSSYFGLEPARRLAAGIPDAKLIMLTGEPGELGIEGFTAIGAFLSGRDTKEFGRLVSEMGQTGISPEGPPNMAVILFADIAESTALTERLGDAAFRERARDLDGLLRGIIREGGGTPIEGKLLGDGVLATFASARQAIEAALRCGTAGDEGGLPLHLGLHAGDVIREENNVYGGAVNIAARISAGSAPGEVLVSDIVRGLARTSAGVSFEDHGERELKGVGELVRVWAARERA